MTIIDTTSDTVTSQFVEEDINRPTGKLTDCQAPFCRRATAGLKLLDFAIRERRGGCRVTFPAPQYIPDRRGPGSDSVHVFAVLIARRRPFFFQ
jgi:hypothetical protein